ncbi:MAG: site-specific integrase [Alphaproteobacteria bacterium]|nr:site-specific integrase [Alphaproteobacteria bacterium]
MASIEKRIDGQGDISYRVKVRLKGYPVQSATFQRLTDAKKWAVHTEASIREGRHFKHAEAKKHTLAELVDRYIAQIIPQKPKSGGDYKYQLEYWKAELGHVLLSDLTAAAIVEKRDALANTSKGKKKRSPATINRYLSALSHACTIAVKEWGWMEDSPMRKISKYKEPRGRVRFLDDDERTALLEASKNTSYPHLHLIIVLALSTGARKSEILNLKWEDIDKDRTKIILHETKNGERRIISLSGYARSLILEHEKVRRIDTNLLFPSKTGKSPFNIKRSWHKAMEEAGIEDFRFHDLRHSAASYLAMNGATLAEIAEVLGHKTLSMVKRYAHLSEAHTSNVVASMNERIFGDGKTY